MLEECEYNSSRQSVKIGDKILRFSKTTTPTQLKYSLTVSSSAPRTTGPWRWHQQLNIVFSSSIEDYLEEVSQSFSYRKCQNAYVVHDMYIYEEENILMVFCWVSLKFDVTCWFDMSIPNFYTPLRTTWSSILPVARSKWASLLNFVVQGIKMTI